MAIRFFCRGTRNDTPRCAAHEDAKHSARTPVSSGMFSSGHLRGRGPMIRSTVRGTCHHDCPDSCGWEVTVEDRPDGPVAVRLRGNADHPFSQGTLCPKVNPFLDRVYSSERLVQPLRRVGEKGEGSFEETTWEDALEEIGDKFRSVIAEFGGEAVMPYISAGNQSLLAMGFGQRLWHHLGATRTTGGLCGVVAGVGTASTNGTGKGIDAADLRHSKLILLWATNTRLTNRHLWPFIEEAREKGAQVVVIDPIRTMTADSADWFLQPLPGTDVALMLALMHELIRRDLIDHEWVEAHTVGFDELAAHVAAWSPERVGEITGVEPSDIERLAELYGTIRPAAIRTLIGGEHHQQGAMFFRTLTCLPALVGAWRDKGGGFSRSTAAWTGDVIDFEALERPDLLAGRTSRAFDAPHLGKALTDPLDPPVKALVLVGVNPLVSVPDTEKVRAGLEREDLFTVAHEQFMTDTARYADIILPATTQIEAVDVVQPWGHMYLGWNNAAIPPVGEAVSNSELHRRLAAALGCTEPTLFDDDIKALTDALPTVDLNRLRVEGRMGVNYPENSLPFPDGGFPTPSGRVEFASDSLGEQGHPRLPEYLPAAESPSGNPSLASRYPMVLLTPKQHTRFLNSSYSHLPKHGPKEGMPYLEICAADAERLDLIDSGEVLVWNDRASLRLPIRISDRLRQGVVAIPWGWWAAHHPDRKTVNSLTGDTLTDWGGGTAFGDTLVAVKRV
jgi:anaerobic selenocysteine-containing dehydrogenase